jgi:uncharacterized protein
MLNATHETLLRLVAARPRTVLLLAAALAAAATPLLLRGSLDVSFRPLFADDEAASTATATFAAEFGQPGGAWIGAVVEPLPGVAPARLTAALAAAAMAAAALPGVAEVAPADGPDAVTGDGRYRLLLARLDIPLQDLAARTEAVNALRAQLDAVLGDHAILHHVGVSVVEAAYAEIVLRSLGVGLLLCIVAVALLLWLVFGTAGGVIVPLAGVTLALPLTLGLLAVAGQKLTIVNSMVPTMMLIIGVADAVHMLQAYTRRRQRREPHEAAVRGMYLDMALPCLLTTITTAFGFLALQTAGIAAVRDFGANVAIGVCTVYVMNLLLVPALLHALPVGWLPVRATGTARLARRWTLHAAGIVRRRPLQLLGACGLAVVAMFAVLPTLDIAQRFNEEVSAAHPVRASQALLEREFGGFLGPELHITRSDGATIDSAGLAAIAVAAAALHEVADIDRVDGPLTSPHGSAALFIRTGDIGSRAALVLGRAVEASVSAALGRDYRVRVVGEWWLAQLGMAGLLHDMVRSLTASALLVLPLLALALRSRRLILAAVLPNLLPLLAALAFMAAFGISVRIGTSMILAIALAIGVDDTIHMLTRIRAEQRRTGNAGTASRRAIGSAGTGIIFTSAVLIAGFLAMAATPLLAIRDMGIVAAATLLAALLADLYVAPAAWLLPGRRRIRQPAIRQPGQQPGRLRNARVVATSSDGSAGVQGRTMFNEHDAMPR